MKVIFLGTPSFAATALTAILNSPHDVVAVVTQPDKVNARGGKVNVNPVKLITSDKKIPLFQFEKVSRDGVEALKEFNADIMVTAAYGQILSQKVLDIAKHGVINIHASILPKYRGASPVQCAILNGESEIGVTIMKTALAVDSGDTILTKKLALSDENAQEATEKLAVLGAQAVVEALNLIESGQAVFTPQNHTEATFCKKILKEDALLNFNQKTQDVVNFVRAMAPSPAAFVLTNHGKLKIFKVKKDEGAHVGTAGEIALTKKSVSVACSDGAVELLIVQGEGGKVMSAIDYFRGKPSTSFI
jgi:methionyl-tRNA formyltransferase